MLDPKLKTMLKKFSDEELAQIMAWSILERDGRNLPLDFLLKEEGDATWEEIIGYMLSASHCDEVLKAVDIIRQKYIPFLASNR